MKLRTSTVAGLAAAVLAVALAAGWPSAQAQSAGDVLRNAIRTTPVTQRDASDGLRTALDVSAKAVTDRLSKPDGFWGDPKVRIPLPSGLARAQRGLKPLGLAGPLDDLQVNLNRAAEGAMPAAGRILQDAIRGITFQDALTLLRGGDTAATTFLRRRTETSLIALLAPPMEQALTRTGAYSALEGLGNRSGLGNLMSVSRKDLTDFAVKKTLDAAFFSIAEEERSIRRDPAKRTNDILRRVFGGR
jgi:hypothetical protein